MQWLELTYPDVFMMTYAVPNGAHLARGFLSFRRLQKEGFKKGVPDICIAYPVGEWHGAYIEMKKRNGKGPNPEQARWLRNLSMKGFNVGVCFCADDAIGFTECYLSWKKGSKIKPLKK